jgi:drug/metabolite transporter (DMT)-like permease
VAFFRGCYVGVELRRVALQALVGPCLLLVGALIWAQSDLFWDRSQVTLLIAVPLILLAPAVTGLMATRERSPGNVGIALISLVLGAAVTVVLAASTGQVDCNDHPTTNDIVARALPAGLIAALAFALAAALTRRAMKRGHAPARALAIGVLAALLGGVACFVVLLAAYRPLSCASV